MCDLVARTGRHQQRYEGGCRLIAGCIPFRYKNSVENQKVLEVLMISSQSGPGLLFPKGGWENDETVEEAAKREAIEEAGVRGVLEIEEIIPVCGISSHTVIHPRTKIKDEDFVGVYYFKSKSNQDEFCPEGLCKASVFSMRVEEELEAWPEQSTRQRAWLTVPEAIKRCRYPWIKEALEKDFSQRYCTDSTGNKND